MVSIHLFRGDVPRNDAERVVGTFVESITAEAYLTGPEGDEGAEGVAGLSLGGLHLLESSTESDGEGAVGGSLNLDLGHLEGAEGDVGEDLGGGGTSEPDEGLVLVGGLLTSEVHVEILEDFVETILEHSLERVADEGGTEALPETLGALLSRESLQGGDEAVVLGGVDL